MSMFSIGYDEVNDKIARSPRYSMSCNNCAYFSQELGDKEEVCQNDEVTDYDLVIDGNNMYCSYWKQFVPKDKQDTLFRNTSSHRSRRYSL